MCYIKVNYNKNGYDNIKTNLIIKYFTFLFIYCFLCFPVNATALHPHVGNTYFVGSDNSKITLYRNDTAQNPTYSQLVSFIKSDKTDMNRYVNGKYECSEFARDVYNNAEKAGIRSAWVAIEFNKGDGHALNAFQTLDKGLVYIDCTGTPARNNNIKDWDKIVTVKVGSKYQPSSLYPPNYTFSGFGIVKHINKFW